MGIHVTADAHVIVRAPMRAPLSVINQFVADTMPWILKTQRKAHERYQQTSEQRRLYAERFAQLGTNYRRLAADMIEGRVHLMADAHGFKFSRIRITSARSRWGSCSSKGTLSFTWRLILAPEWIIDYVVAHELSHLQHRNHSRQFWGCVAQLFPHFKEARKWLRENHSLMKLEN